jgi:hypothetical protein
VGCVEVAALRGNKVLSNTEVARRPRPFQHHPSLIVSVYPRSYKNIRATIVEEDPTKRRKEREKHFREERKEARERGEPVDVFLPTFSYDSDEDTEL